MIKLRKSEERGKTNIDWLKSYHSFSFGDYYDPSNMGFHSLRVVNEDYVAPGKGFGSHPHKNMEIITVVLSGALKHQDSLGSSSVINPNIIQKMSAGKGIIHSEFNNSDSEEVHLYQIWIVPSEMNLASSYEEAPIEDKGGRIYLAGNKDEGALISIHQDAKLHICKIEPGKTDTMTLLSNRNYWFQVLDGEGEVNGIKIEPGDGFSVEGGDTLNFTSPSNMRLFEFDLGS